MQLRQVVRVGLPGVEHRTREVVDSAARQRRSGREVVYLGEVLVDGGQVEEDIVVDLDGEARLAVVGRQSVVPHAVFNSCGSAVAIGRFRPPPFATGRSG